MTPNERSLAELTDLSGKVAIVTGAAQGLGFEVASRLAEAGAAVVVNDLDEARAGEAVAQIVAAGGRATRVGRRRLPARRRRGAARDGARRLRPRRHPRQQRRHLADEPVSRGRREPLDEDAGGQPDRHAALLAGRRAQAGRAGRGRRDRQHRLDRRGRAASRRPRRLRRQQGRRRQRDEDAREVARGVGDPRQRRPARRHGDAGRDEHPAPERRGHPARPSRAPGRGCARGALPRERPGLLRDRRRARRRRRRHLV